MRFASFEIDNTTSWGLVEDDAIADLGALLRARFPDLKSAIAAGALSDAAASAAKAKRHALSDIIWLFLASPAAMVL